MRNLPSRRADPLDWKSAALSAVMHTALLVGLSLGYRGCLVPPRSDAPGAPSEFVATLTILSESEIETPETIEVETPPTDSQPVDAEPTELSPDDAAEVESPVSEQPAEQDQSQETQIAKANFLTPLTSEQANRPAPGASSARPLAMPSRQNPVRRPPKRVAKLPVAETGLFGISDRGQRLLYVIDRSASMGDDQSMRAAKDELAASVARLEPTQRFQVLFYNTRTSALEPPVGAAAREGYFFGTEEHRRAATRQWNAVKPSGGTRHLAPLKEALSYRPDVVFFLTDGEEPGITNVEIENITRTNGGRCRIHCIRFGRGGDVASRYSFLWKLARANGGQYAYRDTTRF